jgi:hypothetical protein
MPSLNADPSVLAQVSHHVTFSSTSIAPCRWLRAVWITEDEATAGLLDLVITKLFSDLNQLNYYSSKLSIFGQHVVNMLKFPFFFALDRDQRHFLPFQKSVNSRYLMIPRYFLWEVLLPKCTYE